MLAGMATACILGPNGHLVMAYAYLKGLGCDGNIGTITVDLDAKKAEATDGHKIVFDKQRRSGRSGKLPLSLLLHRRPRQAKTRPPA